MEKWILLGTILIRKILFCGSVKANGVILADIVNQLDTTNSLVAWAFSLQNGIALLISPLVMFLLNYFSERQLCMVGGLLGGLGYIYCGLMMTSVYQLFIGLSVSVSLGKTQGLTDEESVFLSTAGGLGGFIGKCSAAVLFKFKLVNPFTATLIPCFTTAAVFIVATMSTDFHLLLALIFISGLTQGINSSCVFSLMPGSVCPYHYRQILILECLSCGLGTQFSGYVSGTIQDVTGSTIYVYLFNAMLSVLMVLLSIWWACDPEPNLECDKSLL
ncbi:hypothetical protein BSL78_25795 [Apostichopus japonicus]|uniref:Uncharacterized protein n=1 Tax=Stichopus japonicus TaxID=307972 RepID=A0A2G8JNT1_STIJA|nr:hypothetical protein BSL78_25795 [Apostichopus japonicus]